MRKTFTALLTGIVLASPLSVAFADTVVVATAAGYRKPLLELIEAFSHTSPIRIESSFGHMKQIETQARQNPEISMLIGDEKFIRPMQLAESYIPLGQGKLTLIYGKQHQLNTLEDLNDESIQRIATPDQKRAVYGVAAIECLQHLGLYTPLQEKIIESDSVHKSAPT